jgi:hypothetical protein
VVVSKNIKPILSGEKSPKKVIHTPEEEGSSLRK